MLTHTCNLTRLDIQNQTDVGYGSVQPGVLAGKAQLQHLDLSAHIRGGAAGHAELLSHLAALSQLTFLRLSSAAISVDNDGETPLAAAYAALTASSRLRTLNIQDCALPAEVWQHVFLANRVLPHLTALNLGCIELPSDSLDRDYHTAPDTSSLLSCCPGLRFLDITGLDTTEAQLGPLRALPGFTLVLNAY
jgi:hypothetical protein